MENKKINIQIKRRFSGNVLVEYEKENNTIKDTIEEAVKQRANLYGADLYGAYLKGADLEGADLKGANLYGADLKGVYLEGADLEGADLRGAYLEGAYLKGANLYGADLYGANLKGAYLKGADLYGANLKGAYLYGADLKGAKEIPYYPLACPTEGSFVGWKKISGKLVKLEIPEDARRSSATTRKCRCDKAKVLAITGLDGENPIDEVLNTSQQVELLYKVGEIVLPDSFDENRWNECSHGIHFFINKQDAIDY